MKQPEKGKTSAFYLSRITCAHLKPLEIFQGGMVLVFMMALGAFIEAGISTTAAAQPQTPSSVQFELPPGMDANHDDVVTHAEYRSFFDRQFKQMDANGDGRITKPEFLQGIDAQIKRDLILAGHGER